MRKTFTAEFKAKVVLEILREEKTISQLASEYGAHPNQLTNWKKEVIAGLPVLLADRRRKDDEKEALELQVQDLFTQLGEVTAQFNWLKKNLELILQRNERVSLLDYNDQKMSVVKQANMLSLNRTSLYYKPVPPSDDEVKLKHAIDRIYTADPCFGSRTITTILQRENSEMFTDLAGMNLPSSSESMKDLHSVLVRADKAMYACKLKQKKA